MVLNARQIASGAALLISAFCAFVLYARGFELQMQLGCVLLVCIFAYLFLSSGSPNREDTEESSQ
jgi:cell division protein FtsW (lipid II flippase)